MDCQTIVHVLHKFLTFQVTLLIWASVILHAVHVELDELVLKDDMLGEGGVLDVLVAEHTVISLDLEWLYEGLGHVLDQGVCADVLVVPAKDVHWGVDLAINSQYGDNLFLYWRIKYSPSDVRF